MPDLQMLRQKSYLKYISKRLSTAVVWHPPDLALNDNVSPPEELDIIPEVFFRL